MAASVAATAILGLGAAGFYQGYASIARPVSHIAPADVATSSPAVAKPDPASALAVAVAANAPASDTADAPPPARPRHIIRIRTMSDPSGDTGVVYPPAKSGDSDANDQPLKVDASDAPQSAD